MASRLTSLNPTNMRRKRFDGLHIFVDVCRGPINSISEAKALNSEFDVGEQLGHGRTRMSLNFAAQTAATVIRLGQEG